MTFLKFLLVSLSLSSMVFAGNRAVPGGNGVPNRGAANNNLPEIAGARAGARVGASHMQSFKVNEGLKLNIQNLCGEIRRVQAQPDLDGLQSIPNNNLSHCAEVTPQPKAVENVSVVVPGINCTRPTSLDSQTETLNYCGCLRTSFLGTVAERNDLTKEVRDTYKSLSTSGPKNKELKTDIVAGLMNSYMNIILRQYSNHKALYGEESFDLPESCKPAQMIAALEESSKGFQSGEMVTSNCNGANCAEAPEIAAKAVRDLFKLKSSETIDESIVARSDSRLVSFAGLNGVQESSCVRSASTENLLTLMPLDDTSKTELSAALLSSIAELEKAKDSIGNCSSSHLPGFESVVDGFTNRSAPNQDLINSFEIVSRLNSSVIGQFYQARKRHGNDSLGEDRTEACKQIKKVISSSLRFYKEVREVNAATNAANKLDKLDSVYNDLVNDTKLSKVQLERSSSHLEAKFKKDCEDLLGDISLLACSDSNVLQTEQLRSVRNLGTRLRSPEAPSSMMLAINGVLTPVLDTIRMVRGRADCALVSSVDCKAQDLVLCDTVNPGVNTQRPRVAIAPSLNYLNSDTVKRSLSQNSPFSPESFDNKRKIAVGQYCAGFGAHIRSLPECRDVAPKEKELCIREKFYAHSDDPEVNRLAGERLQNAITIFSSKPGVNPDIKKMLQAVVASTNAHGSLGEENVIADLVSQNNISRHVNSDLSSGRVTKSDLESYADVLGGLGGAGEISATNMISPTVAQAFANQSKMISPSTSASIMNRFIATVPPINSMNSTQARQEVDRSLERSVNQTVTELESKAASSVDASERQKYLDEIAELRRMMADQNTRNDLVNQQIASMTKESSNDESTATSKRKRAPANVATAPVIETDGGSNGFTSGGSRNVGVQSATGNIASAQDLAGGQGFGTGTAAARSVSSVSAARDADPSDKSLRLVVGGNGGQEISASQIFTITLPRSGDEQALKDAIMVQRENLNIGADGYAVVEVIDSESGKATLVRVKIENEKVIVQNFTAEQLRNASLVSESNPEPRRVKYSLQAMTNLLNQASGGSN